MHFSLKKNKHLLIKIFDKNEKFPQNLLFY